MRVLLTASAWPGHYYPMVPLGWALQAAGHEVRVACTPSQVETVCTAGLTPVPVVQNADMVFLTRLKYVLDAQAGHWSYPWLPLHPETGVEMRDLGDFKLGAYLAEHKREFVGRIQRSFDGVVEFAREWRPDLVVHEPLSMEGMLAAAVVGVPAVVHTWGPVGVHETHPTLRLVPDYPPMLFAKYGVGHLDGKSIRHVIDPCPAALAPPVGSAQRLPVRFVPYNGPGAMPTWVLDAPRRPRVCVVWGSTPTVMSGPRSFVVPRIIEALDGLDVSVVLTGLADDVANLGPLPDNVRVLERFPLRLLLPDCAAVVHHGGAGCLMTAVWAGVPQLGLTVAPEPEANTTRLAHAGAGLHIRADVADAEAIRAGLVDLLEKPTYRDGAALLRDQLVERPTPAALVRTLEQLA